MEDMGVDDIILGLSNYLFIYPSDISPFIPIAELPTVLTTRRFKW